jgi:hypothetical protein
MLILGVALSILGIAAMAGAGWLWLGDRKRAGQKQQIEQAVAKAALEYLTRFGVRCGTAAIAVSEKKIALLVETEPQKKLRFSYIIEQPLKDFVQRTTGLSVRWVYWRFPVSQKPSTIPEIKYREADTLTVMDNRDELPPVAEETATGQGEVDIDEYFQEQAYQIEEVGWEQYDTTSGQPAKAHASDPKPDKPSTDQ